MTDDTHCGICGKTRADHDADLYCNPPGLGTYWPMPYPTRDKYADGQPHRDLPGKSTAGFRPLEANRSCGWCGLEHAGDCGRTPLCVHCGAQFNDHPDPPWCNPEHTNQYWRGLEPIWPDDLTTSLDNGTGNCHQCGHSLAVHHELVDAVRCSLCTTNCVDINHRLNQMIDEAITPDIWADPSTNPLQDIINARAATYMRSGQRPTRPPVPRLTATNYQPLRWWQRTSAAAALQDALQNQRSVDLWNHNLTTKVRDCIPNISAPRGPVTYPPPPNLTQPPRPLP